MPISRDLELFLKTLQFNKLYFYDDFENCIIDDLIEKGYIGIIDSKFCKQFYLLY
jgi:hypothetical protein